MVSRIARITLLAAVGAVIGGCGEQRDPRSATARTTPEPVRAPVTVPAGAGATIELSLIDYRLQPAEARVARPGLVAFVATNDGQARHALAVDGPAGTVRSSPLRPGEQTTLVVRLAPGTYRWYCPLADHEQLGMAGRVRVAE